MYCSAAFHASAFAFLMWVPHPRLWRVAPRFQFRRGRAKNQICHPERTRGICLSELYLRCNSSTLARIVCPTIASVFGLILSSVSCGVCQ